MSDHPCCRLDEEFICGIIRHRPGVDSGELDYCLRADRTDKEDLKAVIAEVQKLLERLSEMDYLADKAKELAGWSKSRHLRCKSCDKVYRVKYLGTGGPCGCSDGVVCGECLDVTMDDEYICQDCLDPDVKRLSPEES
jgi:hypothetical protein